MMFVDTLAQRQHTLDQTSSESVIAEVSKLSLDITSNLSHQRCQNHHQSTENELDRTLPLTKDQ